MITKTPGKNTSVQSNAFVYHNLKFVLPQIYITYVVLYYSIFKDGMTL